MVIFKINIILYLLIKEIKNGYRNEIIIVNLKNFLYIINLL